MRQLVNATIVFKIFNTLDLRERGGRTNQIAEIDETSVIRLNLPTDVFFN